MVKDMRDLGPLATSDYTALEWKLVLECRRKRNEAVNDDYVKADYEEVRKELRKSAGTICLLPITLNRIGVRSEMSFYKSNTSLPRSGTNRTQDKEAIVDVTQSNTC